MPVDPEQRAGKGEFPKLTIGEPLDGSLIEQTIEHARTRTTIFDYLYLLVVGFASVLRGFARMDSKPIQRSRSKET